MTKIILAILISFLVWRAGVAVGSRRIPRCHCRPSVLIEFDSDSEIVEGWLRAGDRICWDLEEVK